MINRANSASDIAQLLLKEIGRDTLLEYFYKRVNSGRDIPSRHLVITALAKLAGLESIPTLSKVAKDSRESPIVRTTAIQAIGSLAKQFPDTSELSESTQLLIELLNDDLSEARSAAAIQLAGLQSLESIPLLRELNDASGLDYLAQEEVQKFLISTTSPFDKLLPPLATHSFVGRDDEIRSLHNAFQNSQIVYLVGIGGIGKTTLAAHFAHQSNYEVKIWRSCRNNFDLAYLATDILRTLVTTAEVSRNEISQPHGELFKSRPDEMEVEITQLLRNRPTLLILDDYESLNESSGINSFIRRLASQSPRLNCLIVGRSIPKAENEFVIKLHNLTQADSIALLRKTTNNKNIVLSPNDEQKLTQLAEGNPLFLNWFASQFSLGIPIDKRIIERDAVSTILGNGLKTLSGSDRRALEVLSQFDEPVQFDDPEAHKIFFQERIESFPLALEHLSQLSFIDINSESKVIIHNLVREFIRQQTDQRSVLRINTALGEYYLNSGKNFQAAIHFIRAEMNSRAIHLFSDHSAEIIKQGYILTTLDLLESATDQRDLDINTKITSLLLIGDFSLFAGRYERAFEAYKQSADFSRDLLEYPYYANSISKMGQVSIQLGKYVEAMSYLKEALQIAQREGNTATYGLLLANLGNLNTKLGYWEQAETYFKEGFKVSRELGNNKQASLILMNLGSIMEMKGDLSQAEHILRESLELARPLNDKQTIIEILGALGNLAIKSGNTTLATRYLQEGISLAESLSDEVNTADLLLKLGEVFFISTDYESAKKYTVEALSIANAREHQALVMDGLIQLGNIHLQSKNFLEARESFQETLTLAEKLGHQEMIAESYLGLAHISAYSEDYPTAIELAQRSLAIFNSLGHYRGNYVKEWLNNVQKNLNK